MQRLPRMLLTPVGAVHFRRFRFCRNKGAKKSSERLEQPATADSCSQRRNNDTATERCNATHINGASPAIRQPTSFGINVGRPNRGFWITLIHVGALLCVFNSHTESLVNTSRRRRNGWMTAASSLNCPVVQTDGEEKNGSAADDETRHPRLQNPESHLVFKRHILPSDQVVGTLVSPSPPKPLNSQGRPHSNWRPPIFLLNISFSETSTKVPCGNAFLDHEVDLFVAFVPLAISFCDTRS